MSNNTNKAIRRWVPEGYTEIARDDALGVLVIAHGRFAKGWSGKRSKPDFFFAFRDEARRDAYVAEYLDGKRKQAEAAARRLAERKAQPAHTLQIGDVLCSTWGYEQTNVEYYEVTKRIGKTMVELRRIASREVGTGYMSGESVPVPGNFIGAPTRHRVKPENTVSLSSFQSAHQLTPTTLDGVKIWPVSRWTSYA